AWLCTGGASTPVDDLGLVDREAVLLRSIQTRSDARGARDVLDAAARAADDVMVVVPASNLVSGQRACGLNAADDASVGERPEAVVDGLVGDGVELGPDR